MRFVKVFIGGTEVGVLANKPADLGLKDNPQADAEKRIRGYGTHFESQEAEEESSRRAELAGQIRAAFLNRRDFMPSAIDGIKTELRQGAAAELAEKFRPLIPVRGKWPPMRLSVQELYIEPIGGWEMEEFAEWRKRLHQNIREIPLGRGKELAEQGVDALKALAECPLLSAETKEQLKSLAAAASVGSVDRVKVKRSLEVMDIKLDETVIKPRRIPAVRSVEAAG